MSAKARRPLTTNMPRPVPAPDLAMMRRIDELHIDELHMDFPFAGSSMLRDLLAAEGIKVGRLHVSTPIILLELGR